MTFLEEGETLEGNLEGRRRGGDIERREVLIIAMCGRDRG